MRIPLWLWILGALLLGSGLGLVFHGNPGYVLIAYDPIAFETTLIFAVIAVLALFAFGVFAVWGVRQLLRTPRGYSTWSYRRRRRSARTRTVHGTMLMTEARWDDARSLLLEAADRSETPYINYIEAAKAAHALGDWEQRDQLLAQAEESTDDSFFVVGLLHGQLLMDDGNWAAAYTVLEPLLEKAPRHGELLRSLSECLVAQENWQGVLKLLPAMRKAHAVSDEELHELGCEAHLGLLAATAQEERANLWSHLPKTFRQDPRLVAFYAEQLAVAGDNAAAGALLADTLKKHWDPALVTAYGLLPLPAEEQRAVAERWLKQHADDPALQLALGRIEARAGNGPAAVAHFEAAADHGAGNDAYGELARSSYALGDSAQGAAYLDRLLYGVAVRDPAPDTAGEADDGAAASVAELDAAAESRPTANAGTH